MDVFRERAADPDMWSEVLEATGLEEGYRLALEAVLARATTADDDESKVDAP